MLSADTATPPVGMMLVHGIGPRIALTNSGPPTEPGNTLTISAPSSSARLISPGVMQPGRYGILRRLHSSAMASSSDGLTMNRAPMPM